MAAKANNMSSPYSEWDQIRNSLLYSARRIVNVPMIEHDMPTFMGVPHAISTEDLKGADAVIIGSPYVASWSKDYGGVDKREWVAAPKRVRQQSIKYRGGYIQEFDVDLFEALRVVDFGDPDISQEALDNPNVDNILKAQQAVEIKVNQVLDAGAIPIVIGQNSPCGSYAVAKPIAERTKGNVGVVSIDTHWDIDPLDRLTLDRRIAGASNWKGMMFDAHKNMRCQNFVEIGERGMHEDKERVREFLKRGTRWYPMWKVREIGIERLCKELDFAYEGTKAVYVHYDMDVLGGAGPAPGDLLGTLAEPIGMTDYEVLRLSLEIGKRGFNGLSFICIPPGSPVMYRVIVYVIMYMLAGRALAKK
jgi:agmatinase